MSRRNDNLEHFGPEPHSTSGAEMVHFQVHEASIGKTIAAAYLGGDEPFRSLQPENSPTDGIFRGEYLPSRLHEPKCAILKSGSIV
jgi:hypothetical protein